MIRSANLGFPRIGQKRELKKATEAYWKGEIDAGKLAKTARGLRAQNWQTQKKAGVDVIPSNDFSLYDQMLDATAMFGALPPRFGKAEGEVALDTYFAMARGNKTAPAMEMTKWFDTNYHYIVPELHADQRFSLCANMPLRAWQEAKALGIDTRPVLPGPLTYLFMGKEKDAGFKRLDLLDKLLPVYAQMLAELAEAGVAWVQLDEPCLVLDLSPEWRAAYKRAYDALGAGKTPRIMLATYFDRVGDNLETLASLPVAGVHIDLVRAPKQLGDVAAALPEACTLSLGVVDGRNIWRADLDKALALVAKAQKARKGDLQIAPSSSLLHAPINLDVEETLDAELKTWMAFATQKLVEVAQLADAARGQTDEAFFVAARAAHKTRAESTRIHNKTVKARTASLAPEMSARPPFPNRLNAQKALLSLPDYPTTTIGSFPQTSEVRKKRAARRRGALSQADYDAFIAKSVEDAIRWQEDIGIDVLVHGEFERNDMVEYFGEQLEGYAFTKYGWVQSYGSRYVKPPIIYGDVARPHPMTVRWTAYAQSLTKKPVKGMLTGPLTMMQWSFVRDDQSRETTCMHIALALRDEVCDLEKAGVRIIQVDEPAFREGLPLRRADWDAYLAWAARAFRVSASGIEEATQIHTHMCYAEFNDIMPSIASLDADVISIETSRSDMEILDAFVDFKYPNHIGPGVYDIHSPRVPETGDMVALLKKATQTLEPQQIWVNPDCGLKTRGWEEVRPALVNLVEAARGMRGAGAKARQPLLYQNPHRESASRKTSPTSAPRVE